MRQTQTRLRKQQQQQQQQQRPHERKNNIKYITFVVLSLLIISIIYLTSSNNKSQTTTTTTKTRSNSSTNNRLTHRKALDAGDSSNSNNYNIPLKNNDQPKPIQTAKDNYAWELIHEIERDIHGLFNHHYDNVNPTTNPIPPNTNPSTSQFSPNIPPHLWSQTQNLLSHHRDGHRFLVGWPTIPISYKGSDSRALDAISFLTEIGFDVDLIFWRDFATEAGELWDDTEDRVRLQEVGIKRILGPFDKTRLSETMTFVSGYFGFIFWLWPDGPYLECLHDFINHIKKMNGATRLIAAVDDTGVAVRNLFASSANKTRPVEDSELFLLTKKRHPDLLGVEAAAVDLGKDEDVPTDEEYVSMISPTYLFHLEMYLYALSDVVVGLNEHITSYLQKFVPGTPARLLSYISPIQPNPSLTPLPFESREGILFFGYDNPANRKAVEWFHDFVLPYVTSEMRFHVAGMVTSSLPDICSCGTDSSSTGDNDAPKTSGGGSCTSLNPRVVCHGALSDEAMDALIQKSRVAINPVLEPSGVATKTCRAMAYGTPVVVSECDGTFVNGNSGGADDGSSLGGARICPMRDAECTAAALNALLQNSEEWTLASQSTGEFIINRYGTGPYGRDWLSILDVLLNKKTEIIIDGDAQFDGQSMSAQNWHLTKTLSSMEEFKVTVMGQLSPPIEGVDRVDPPSNELIAIPDDQNGGLWSRHKSYNSPFPTGFQANVIIRQKWPPSIDPLPLKYCGPGCRIAQILPWEFGALPEKWMGQLPKNVDWLWGPSEYNRKIFERSGFDAKRTAVTPAGIDCETLLGDDASSRGDDAKKKKKKHFDDPVTFVFSGGLLPRKGVDIIMDEWNYLFCSSSDGDDTKIHNNVKLIIHTSYELGYDRYELEKMEQIASHCGNIVFTRQKWMERGEHLEMLKEGDVYIAPFRSEGFGIPIVEAMMLGMRVIASVGGTAADDYMTHSHMEDAAAASGGTMAYAVQSKEVECRHDPCVGDQLCVFSPCWDKGRGRGWRCSCETLEKTPTWFEVDRNDLRMQMKQAYVDVSLSRMNSKVDENNGGQGGGAATDDDVMTMEANNGISSFCWSELGSTYKDAVLLVLKSPRTRHTQKYEMISPESIYIRNRKIKNTIKKICYVGILLLFVYFVSFSLKHTRLKYLLVVMSEGRTAMRGLYLSILPGFWKRQKMGRYEE